MTGRNRHVDRLPRGMHRAGYMGNSHGEVLYAYLDSLSSPTPRVRVVDCPDACLYRCLHSQYEIAAEAVDRLHAGKRYVGENLSVAYAQCGMAPAHLPRCEPLQKKQQPRLCPTR